MLIIVVVPNNNKYIPIGYIFLLIKLNMDKGDIIGDPLMPNNNKYIPIGYIFLLIKLNMDKGDVVDTETVIGGPPIPNYDEKIDDLKELTNLHAFYSFYPVFVTVVIIIWVMVIANLFNWILGLFLTTLAFIILYGFSILYRIQIQALNNKEE